MKTILVNVLQHTEQYPHAENHVCKEAFLHHVHKYSLTTHDFDKLEFDLWVNMCNNCVVPPKDVKINRWHLLVLG